MQPKVRTYTALTSDAGVSRNVSFLAGYRRGRLISSALLDKSIMTPPKFGVEARWPLRIDSQQVAHRR